MVSFKNKKLIVEMKKTELNWINNKRKNSLEQIADHLHEFSINKNNNLDRIYTKRDAKIELLSKIKKSANDNNLLYKIKKIFLKNKDIDKKIKDCSLRAKNLYKQKSDKYTSIISSKHISSNTKKIKIESRTNKWIEGVEKNDDTNPFLFKFKQYFRPFKLINIRNKFISTLNKNKLLIMIALITIFAGMNVSVFFTKQNIMTNILKNNAEIGIMAVGMTFIIITGGIDLSVGSLLGMLGIFTAKGIVDGMNPGVAILLAFILAFIVGAFQGLLVSKLKLPPFIVTLVGLLGYRGLARIIANSKTYVVESSGFASLNDGAFIGIPYIVWIIITVVVLGMIILKLTRFGRNVYAVGGNKEAARMSGVKTWKILLVVYIISATTVAIAVITFTSRVGAYNPMTGNSYELDVISAVVLGGTSLEGGKGGVGKTIIGWLVISTLSNVMNLLGYATDWQLVFKGIIILAAVILDKEYNLLGKIKKLLTKIV